MHLPFTDKGIQVTLAGGGRISNSSANEPTARELVTHLSDLLLGSVLATGSRSSYLRAWLIFAEFRRRFLGTKPSITGADPGFFLGGGCTRLLLYFNTNKPHIFFFLAEYQLKTAGHLAGGGGVRIPCTHPLDPPLIQDLVKGSSDKCPREADHPRSYGAMLPRKILIFRSSER